MKLIEALKIVRSQLNTHAGVHSAGCRAWAYDVKSGTYLKHCTCEVGKAWKQIRKAASVC